MVDGITDSMDVSLSELRVLKLSFSVVGSVLGFVLSALCL